ncbi:MAG: UDP-N-acetylglucosamine--N-acetylmuramyl-(pentapeptide) pyrophosphoryl-undecaprenol N-acetylglucosamine transferase [Caldilineaceae bacterium]|nr:UDP-N-acetylglucosamine--N-acetylmuramyl-(pentapeptide) pyrophosphoryl-undecaprenol N-acetylglucosamine transferase [Caldilineaceae bacterium]
MRVLISGGGSGGHVYPALAVAEQLERAAANQPITAGQAPAGPAERAAAPNQVLWLGSTDGMERALVERADIAYQGIRTGKMRGVNPLRMARSAGLMTAGVRDSLAAIERFGPDVCLVTGGYVCAPVVAACRRKRVPVVVYLPDMKPGWSIQLMSRFARRVAVSFPAAAPYFGGQAPRGKAVVTGYPVRQELVEAAANKQASRQALATALGLDPQGLDDRPLALIWGGSQGARSINRAAWASLQELTPLAHVLHIVGTRDWPLYEEFAATQLSAGQDEEMGQRYHPVAYLHEEMVQALAAADLSIARAGASTLGEFTVTGLPSILVPLPFSGVNQRQNARQLAEHGAAVVLEDETLEKTLAPTATALLKDSAQLAAMAQAARELAQPQAAANIAHLLADVATGSA